MKTVSLTSFLASALFAQQALATGWGDAQSFSNPSNSDNQCSDAQKGGFNWSDLPAGNVGQYNGFQFSGYTCQNSFQSAKKKRSLKLRSDFQSKCIQGAGGKDVNSAPKMACAGADKFSVTSMQVSVDKDTQLDFHYNMPDGSTCKQTHQCSASGTVVTNDQCGGADSFQVAINPNESHDSCQFGIHGMGFDCQPGNSPPKSSSTSSVPTTTTTTTPPATTTTTPPVTTTTTTPVTTTTTTTPVTTTTTPVTTTTTTPETTTTTPATTTTTTTTPVVTTTTSVETTTTTTPVETTTTTPIETTTPPVTTTTSEVPPETLTTLTEITTLTTCPVTITSTSGSTTVTSVTQTVSTTIITSTVTFCPKCTEQPSTSSTPEATTSPVPTTTSPPETTTTPPPETTTTPPPETTTTPPPQTTTTTTTPETTTTTPPQTTTTTSPPETTTTSPPQTTTPPPQTTTTPPPQSTTPPPETTTPPATVTSYEESVITEFTITTLTSCPITVTETTSGTTITKVSTTLSTTVITSTSVVCTKCTRPPPSTLESRTSKHETESSSSAPAPTPSHGSGGNTPSGDSPPSDAPCPDVLPRCLNTWLSTVPSCASNSDSNCFCPSSDFITQVQSCITAWGGSDSQLQAAMSYLAGICADFVPQNPGICTGVPSSITLVPNPATPSTVTVAGTQQAAATQSQPLTTITIVKTIPAGGSQSAGVQTQFVTVPQVQFYTSSVTVTASGGAVQTNVQAGLAPAYNAQPSATSGSGSGNGNAPAASSVVAGYSSGKPASSATRTGSSVVSTFTGAASAVEMSKTLSVSVAGLIGLIALFV